MQDYKIRIPNEEASRAVQQKAFELGYLWASGDTTIRYTYNAQLVIGEEYGIYAPSQQVFDGLNSNSRVTFVDISVDDFLRIGEEQIINNNNMSQQTEIELELVKQPQKAKNLTVGKVYKGIYIDDEETQVDRVKDAKYFYCVNDSGAEARYLVDLFGPVSKKEARPVKEKATPPPPPQPPPQPRVYTIEEVIASLNVSEGSVAAILRENGQRIPILGRGYSSFSHNSSSISCGVFQIYGLNNAWDGLRNLLNIGNIEVTTDIKKAVYSAMLKAKMSSIQSCKFLMMSTQTEREELCEAIDEVVEELGGVSIIGNNPNSGNEIKVWTITKP